MATFSEFLPSLSSDPNTRGKDFERFAKWFLTADPEWATQVDTVWLWDEYPERWGPDCGVDLVFRHKNGDTWAVQAKCYAPDYGIRKKDIDSFISDSDRPEIDRRLLIATTDRIGDNAQRVLDAVSPHVVRFLLSDFEKAEIDYPSSIPSLSQGQRKLRPVPYDYQETAIDAVMAGFERTDRGQLLMACGTGKTNTALWIKERLDAGRTLVLVPSLGLLSQILGDWTFAASVPFDVLCVCSDKSVAKRGADEMYHSVSDVPFPVTSEVSAIKDFLRGSGNQVIFCTYQSSSLIADAQADPSMPGFDLIVADEAHRCAGKVGSEFATVLDNKLIRGDKRLFATATPRIYPPSFKTRAEDRGVEITSMDSTADFGEPFYTLTFGDAISKNLLTDYQVVIVGVDDPMIAEWIEHREWVRTDSDIETDALSLAAQIGLIKAIKDYDLHRIISFHGRVERAKLFSEDLAKSNRWINEKERPEGELRADYVSGRMNAFDRKQKLRQLKSLNENERALLANARCLSEGVDVPALDGVAFIDPRRSQIDIIQAVGRAIRLSSKKQIGTIVIPVFIEHGDDPESAIEASHFKPVWDVLNALKSHDGVLADELNQLRIQLGKNPHSSVGSSSLTKIVIDLPRVIDESFVENLRTHLVSNTTESWMFWYGLLLRYQAENGDCRVPRPYKATDGARLGWWVGTQRRTKDALSAERRARLEALAGWSWDVFADDWEEGFGHLKAFAEEHGHCRVPQQYKTTDGLRLGNWISSQRSGKGSLAVERRNRLEALAGWSWDAFAYAWEEAFAHLKAFAEEHGHCQVPKRYKTPDGVGLGQWAQTQRSGKDSLSADRRARLEALAGWSWDVLADAWEEGFAHLKAFAEEHGDFRVPTEYKTPDGVHLGWWVGTQRKGKDSLSAERRARLEALEGWSWDVLADAWEEGLAHLTAFAKEHGHCRVPQQYKTPDGFRLGSWVANQRSGKDSMSAERRARLEALPGWSWNAFADAWEEEFAHLKAFAEERGDCEVPARYKTPGGVRLGSWVANQRSGKDSLLEERRVRLEALAGWSWDVLADAWEEGFGHLTAFAEEHGHCRVPKRYKTPDGVRLGIWVANQRKGKDSVVVERRARIETLAGWSWDVLADAWEEGLAYLTVFAEEHGHCRVPQRYKTPDGVRLGGWVGTQRSKKDTLSAERTTRLEALQGWSWDPNADAWEEGFAHLKAFAEEHGHCQVPQRYKTPDGVRLGVWVANQRKGKDSVVVERRARLETLAGWSWDVLADAWEEGFAHLKTYVEDYGDCRVPQRYKTPDGVLLGQWVSHQRHGKDSLLEERRFRLEALPGWVWKAR